MESLKLANSSTDRTIAAIRLAENAIEKATNNLGTGEKSTTALYENGSLGFSTRLLNQLSAVKVASKNLSEAQSLLETADSALDEAEDAISRIRELAVRASSSAISASDRTNLELENAQLINVLDNISSNTSFNNERLLSGYFTGRIVQNGPNKGDQFTLNIGSSSPERLGSYTATGPTRSALSVAQTPATNNTSDSEDIILSSNGTDVTIDIASQDSAKIAASKVNGLTNITGVSADAKTYALLFSTNASNANYTIKINDFSTSSFSISSSNATDAVSKINLITASTGVTATATTDNKVLLFDEDGDDITIENANSGVDLDVQAVQSDGSSVQGSAVSLAAGGASNNDSTRIIGTLRLYSHDSFSITQSGNSSQAYAETGTPALSALSSIDLSTATSSSAALAVIDGASAQTSEIRGNIGASARRLESNSSLLDRQSENLGTHYSRITNSDIAAESAALAKAMVLQEINTALLVQANASEQVVLKLLAAPS